MEEKKQEKKGLQISARTVVITRAVLLFIVVLAGVLTLVLPQGSFEYALVDGRQTVVPGTYHLTQTARLPVWHWLTAPVEVLFSSEGVTAAMIIAFLLLIGGTFQVLDESRVLNYIITAVIHRFGHKKYRLLLMMVFLCMLVGSTIGMFEETVTLVPITVALALSLGWDSLVGLGMSILSVGLSLIHIDVYKRQEYQYRALKQNPLIFDPRYLTELRGRSEQMKKRYVRRILCSVGALFAGGAALAALRGHAGLLRACGAGYALVAAGAAVTLFHSFSMIDA